MQANTHRVERERKKGYVPVRYVWAILLTVAEVCAIIGIVVALCYFVPYFYLACWVTELACIVKIVSSDDNPEYKVPWLLFVLILPIVGFMLYFLFYSRSFRKKYLRRLKKLEREGYSVDDETALSDLRRTNGAAYRQAKLLRALSDGRLFQSTAQRYFPSGEETWKAMLEDLRAARSWIYMEYFIIEEGVFWNSILDVLKEKVREGLDVRVLFDDVGCMRTLPGNYSKILRSYGIQAVPFSRLKGQADGEFNNRSHRKMTIIDGKIGYTGGINIADEYVNEKRRFGHWKDVGIRLEGAAVYEMTRLFLVDYGVNTKRAPTFPDKEILYPETEEKRGYGFTLPFGDGPSPLYRRRVAQSMLVDMLANAQSYAYMTTPYLILDNDVCFALENAALKGVDVRIVVPHVPDKKLVFEITKSFYERLMKSGVKIYEYEPGFIHAKTYLVDGKIAMVGTVNLDYRSLVHHFENGVWIYGGRCIEEIKKDIADTLEKSVCIEPQSLKTNLWKRFVRSVVRIFAPLL